MTRQEIIAHCLTTYKMNTHMIKHSSEHMTWDRAESKAAYLMTRMLIESGDIALYDCLCEAAENAFFHPTRRYGKQSYHNGHTEFFGHLVGFDFWRKPTKAQIVARILLRCQNNMLESIAA